MEDPGRSLAPPALLYIPKGGKSTRKAWEIACFLALRPLISAGKKQLIFLSFDILALNLDLRSIMN